MLRTTEFTLSSNSESINIDALSKYYSTLIFLNSNAGVNTNSSTEIDQLIALGSIENLEFNCEKINFDKLDAFAAIPNQWKFGFISYDVKNSIENLDSINDDLVEFPLLKFVIPELVLETKSNLLLIHYNNQFTTEESVQKAYQLATSKINTTISSSTPVKIKNKISKEDYLDVVKNLKAEIQLGNIYEINFCHEFFASNQVIDPIQTFYNLNKISAAPFASFCMFNNHYIISSSPERFIKKKGNKLISQPIKGTAKRSPIKEEDEKLKIELKNNPKEQNENVMIVDLVRNDLSKVAEKGTVKVEELFGVYSFKQVHQLISTISCQLKEQLSFSEIIKALFPMGSMTGAPKIRAMQLIEKYEKTKRGVYSGCLGYIKPNGDFDFNVIIRTILYNASKKNSSFMVGSAITSKSEAIFEYEECLLKAEAMKKVLE